MFYNRKAPTAWAHVLEGGLFPSVCLSHFAGDSIGALGNGLFLIYGLGGGTEYDPTWSNWLPTCTVFMSVILDGCKLAGIHDELALLQVARFFGILHALQPSRLIRKAPTVCTDAFGGGSSAYCTSPGLNSIAFWCAASI